MLAACSLRLASCRVAQARTPSWTKVHLRCLHRRMGDRMPTCSSYRTDSEPLCRTSRLDRSEAYLVHASFSTCVSISFDPAPQAIIKVETYQARSVRLQRVEPAHAVSLYRSAISSLSTTPLPSLSSLEHTP